MVRIVVKPTRRGLNKATRTLSSAELYLLVRGSMIETLDILKDIVKRTTPVDTGASVAGIYTEIHGTNLKDMHGIVASDDAHFSVLEYGRRPGSRMPPEAPIAAWAARQGIPATAVFPIQRAIAERGLPALHIMQKALVQGPQHFKTVYLKRWLQANA